VEKKSRWDVGTFVSHRPKCDRWKITLPSSYRASYFYVGPSAWHGASSLCEWRRPSDAECRCECVE